MRARMVWVVASLLAACTSDVGEPVGQHAQAVLAAKSGNTTLAGTATFSMNAGHVSLAIDVKGVPPGVHAVHIHETGDCSAMDAMSAGGHWNPEMHMHGQPDAMAHLGDLGNIEVASDGTAHTSVTNAGWTLSDGGASDVTGKAIIVHAMPDDFVTQPTGNAGGRIGCGVIREVSATVAASAGYY